MLCVQCQTGWHHPLTPLWWSTIHSDPGINGSEISFITVSHKCVATLTSPCSPSSLLHTRTVCRNRITHWEMVGGEQVEGDKQLLWCSCSVKHSCFSSSQSLLRSVTKYVSNFEGRKGERSYIYNPFTLQSAPTLHTLINCSATLQQKYELKDAANWIWYHSCWSSWHLVLLFIIMIIFRFKLASQLIINWTQTSPNRLELYMSSYLSAALMNGQENQNCAIIRFHMNTD